MVERHRASTLDIHRDRMAFLIVGVDAKRVAQLIDGTLWIFIHRLFPTVNTQRSTGIRTKLLLRSN